MLEFVRKSIVGKIALCFITAIAAAIIIVGYLSFYNAKNSLVNLQFEKLNALRDTQLHNVKTYIREVGDHLRYLSGTNGTRQGIGALVADGDHSIGKDLDKTEMKDAMASPDPNYMDRLQKLRYTDAIYKKFLEIHGSEDGYDDLLVLCAAHGHVIYSSKRMGDLGGNIHDNLKETGLAKVFEKVMSTQRPAFIPFSVYPLINRPAAFFGNPIYDMKDSAKLIGVLVMRVSPRHFNDIMKLSHEAGKTAETYLVGSDRLMVTDSRFSPESSILKQQVDTEPVKSALEGKPGYKTTNNYRGDNVFSSYAPVGLPAMKDAGSDSDFALVAELSAAEATQPATDFAYKTIFIALFLSLAGGIIAYFPARAIAKPIVALADHVKEVGQGNLNIQVPAQRRDDEVGVLARTIAGMVKSLREHTAEILEGVHTLSSSAAEISATVQQVSVSSAKTSSAIAETTTTVEEVKQAAMLSSEQAKNVAETANESVQVSENGRIATEDMVNRITLIKEQMESIKDTVVRLNEESHAIEKIVATVQDLADQSNLLAVNASIEAARAGDQGKSFAVVAHEIKSLADQSKEATQEVKKILEDTRKWIGAVVTTMEQGNLAVDAGVHQSATVGESIRLLARSVETSAQSATVIESSSAQQFVGMDQVSAAMSNIELAMQQNVTATSQLGDAIVRIEGLGEALKNLVQYYKL